MAVCINAHGGGCVAYSAKDELGFIFKLASQNEEMIFMNLEFRNAPEAKAPKGA